MSARVRTAVQILKTSCRVSPRKSQTTAIRLKIMTILQCPPKVGTQQLQNTLVPVTDNDGDGGNE